MLILAIGHRKRTGKDTFAGFVANHVRLNTRRKNVRVVGFADKVKEVAYILYGWTGLMPGPFYEIEDNAAKRELKTICINGEMKSPRDIWIDVGQHVRKYDDNAWLNASVQTNSCDLLIFKDIRFPTETTGVEQVGGILLKVDNPRIPFTDDEADVALANFSGWHHNMINDQDLAHLRHLAIDFASTYIIPKLEG